MNIKNTLAILILMGTSLVSAMGHDPRPLARVLQLLKHLQNVPALTHSQAPSLRLDQGVIGKHKHLFNFICCKIVGAIDL